MKSIMEQASSIVKAIEKAWNNAENPKEFSVKIFEKEEKNFFGMTTKPAKIALLWSEKPQLHSEPKSAQHKRPEPCVKTPENTPSPQPMHSKPSAEKNNLNAQAQGYLKEKQFKQKPQTKTIISERSEEQRHQATSNHNQNSSDATTSAHSSLNSDQTKKISTAWNESMIATVTMWINTTLPFIGIHNIGFDCEVAGRNLKLTFSQPLIENPITEKQLFRSLAHLIMASLRNQYKQEIKDLKVVLIRPQ